MNRQISKLQRQTRSRKKTAIVTDRPRLSVFRSNSHIYAQIINIKGDTIIGVTDKKTVSAKATPVENAKQVGLAIAKLAIDKKIKQVAFDKGRFAYHGQVKAVAEGAREGGLEF